MRPEQGVRIYEDDEARSRRQYFGRRKSELHTRNWTIFLDELERRKAKLSSYLFQQRAQTSSPFEQLRADVEDENRNLEMKVA